MEPTEVWPGIDSALRELGKMMCSGDNNHEKPKDLTEKPRVQLTNFNLSATANKCHDRYLLPSQAWNRPVPLSDVEGVSSQHDSLRNNSQPSDGENTENSYSIKSPRIVKISDPKGGVPFGNTNPYTPCRPEGIRENQGLNVLKMNTHYMTGVSIATAGTSAVAFDKIDSYAKSNYTHYSPKQGLPVQPVRHHHMRPYEIPWRWEGRERYKCEAAKKEAAMKVMDRMNLSQKYSVVDNYANSYMEKCRRCLLKSRSLENVRLAEDEIIQVPVHEMDSMSNRIQHLHVDE